MRMQKPNRVREVGITECFPDGIVTIYVQKDRAEAGYAPKAELIEKGRLRYRELRVGWGRYYQSKQNQVAVERMLRVPRMPVGVNSQDIAETEDGVRYRVDLAQTTDGVYPPCLDLTLVKYEGGGTDGVDG